MKEKGKQGGEKKWCLELGGGRDNELTATPGAYLEELHPEASLGSWIVEKLLVGQTNL